MSKVITFSRYFPAHHPRKGEPTYFVEQIYNGVYSINDWSDALGSPTNYTMNLNAKITGIKHHTIRAGNRWKVGDKFSPRVWSGKPYNSKQIIIAPDIEIKRVWDVNFRIRGSINFRIVNHRHHFDHEKMKLLAKNDGLSYDDFMAWFCNGKDWDFKGQIICWNENIIY
jgi:hypothetical protein